MVVDDLVEGEEEGVACVVDDDPPVETVVVGVEGEEVDLLLDVDPVGVGPVCVVLADVVLVGVVVVDVVVVDGVDSGVPDVTKFDMRVTPYLFSPVISAEKN